MNTNARPPSKCPDDQIGRSIEKMTGANLDRRKLIKTAAAMGAMGMVFRGGNCAAAATTDRHLSVAGYAYDRIRAIQDGAVGIGGFDVSFHAENIYGLNAKVFGPTQEYAVSEVGLIPYIAKFANEDFRAYSLVPVSARTGAGKAMPAGRGGIPSIHAGTHGGRNAWIASQPHEIPPRRSYLARVSEGNSPNAFLYSPENRPS